MPNKPAVPGTGFHGPIYLHDKDLNVTSVIRRGISSAVDSITALAGTATLAEVITKVNELIAALKVSETE